MYERKYATQKTTTTHDCIATLVTGRREDYIKTMYLVCSVCRMSHIHYPANPQVSVWSLTTRTSRTAPREWEQRRTQVGIRQDRTCYLSPCRGISPHLPSSIFPQNVWQPCSALLASMCWCVRTKRRVTWPRSWSTWRPWRTSQTSSSTSWRSGLTASSPRWGALPQHGDAFVCCVLSHGDRGVVTGVDGEQLPIEDITSPFQWTTLPGFAWEAQGVLHPGLPGEGSPAGIGCGWPCSRWGGGRPTGGLDPQWMLISWLPWPRLRSTQHSETQKMAAGSSSLFVSSSRRDAPGTSACG